MDRSGVDLVFLCASISYNKLRFYGPRCAGHKNQDIDKESRAFMEAPGMGSQIIMVDARLGNMHSKHFKPYHFPIQPSLRSADLPRLQQSLAGLYSFSIVIDETTVQSNGCGGVLGRMPDIVVGSDQAVQLGFEVRMGGRFSF
ncbi:hypothetical protein PM082_008773 [Marasmius tenuissimus]|nr:hypothetical protein PM082_008773 [Marasmius tenuissimus]